MAGGYLVLEQPNVGIVIGATARFHSTVDLVRGRNCFVAWMAER